MAPPEGFSLIHPTPISPGHSLRLQKALYGLKQSGRSWNVTITEFLTGAGFTRCLVDPCIYTRKSAKSLIAIVLYVDDLLIASDSRHALNSFKKELSDRFRIKDLRPTTHILGIKVTRNRSAKTISLDQETFIRSITERFNLTNAAPVSTPLPSGFIPTTKDSPTTDADIAEMKKRPYLQALGMVMFAMIATRPDICYSVGVLSRFSSNPGPKHWKALQYLIRYLASSASKTLVYRNLNGQAHITTFTDSDFAADPDTRHSTSGYTLLINGTAIAWSSRRQRVTTTSTAEAEYTALAAGIQELIWANQVLYTLGAPQERPLVVYSDNQAAIFMAKNPSINAATKHIDVKLHFIRDFITDGLIDVRYIPTASQLADLLTKPIPRDRHLELTTSLGLN